MIFTRKKNRLPNRHLYEKNHWYFITICTKDRICILSDITTILSVESDTVGHNAIKDNNTIVESDTVGHNDRVRNHIVHHTLTPLGSLIQSIRYQLPHYFTNIVLDEFVIMPNHIHGIIGFDGQPYSTFTNKPSDLGIIIKRFKLETIRESKKQGYYEESFRQTSFYDHIIRNQKDLIRIQEYIINNPLQRNNDRFYS